MAHDDSLAPVGGTDGNPRESEGFPIGKYEPVSPLSHRGDDPTLPPARYRAVPATRNGNGTVPEPGHSCFQVSAPAR